MDYHHAIAARVKPFGEEWRNEDNLEEIAEQLDRDNISIPPKSEWRTLKPAARSWKRAVENFPRFVRKAITYSLKMASRDIPD